MVDTLDTTIDRLNREYQRRLATAATNTNHDPDVRSGKVSYDRGVTGNRIEAELRPQAQHAWGLLDDDADTVATRFRQGATADNVRHLVLTGMIPLSSAGLYPTLHLTAAQKEQASSAADQDPWMTNMLQLLGVLPADGHSLPADISFGAGVFGFGFGGLASWVTKGALGTWQPNFRLPSGMLSYQSLARGWRGHRRHLGLVAVGGRLRRSLPGRG